MKTITANQRELLRCAAKGHRLTRREAEPLDRRGLLIRHPGTGWAILTAAGWQALAEE